MLILLYFAAAFGFCYVVGHSKVSYRIRVFIGGREPERVGDVDVGAQPPALKIGPALISFLECPAWIGWWVGALAAPLILNDFNAIAAIILLAFSTSGVNFALGRMTGII